MADCTQPYGLSQQYDLRLAVISGKLHASLDPQKTRCLGGKLHNDHEDRR